MKNTYFNTLNENHKLLTLDFALCLFFIIVSSFQLDPLFCFVVFLLMVFVFAFQKSTCNTICRDPKVISLLIVLLFVLVHAFPVGGVEHTGTAVASMLGSFSAIFIFDHFKHPSKRKQFMFIYKFGWVLCIFLCLYSLVFYIIFPGAARNHRDYNFLFTGYGLACAISIFSVFLLGLLVTGFFNYNKKIKLFITIAIIIMALTVYKTESTLTLIILLLGYISCFYFKKNNKSFFYIRLLILPIIILGIIFLMPLLGQWIIDISEARMDDSRMFKRLFSLGHFLVYGTDNAEAIYSINRITIPFTTLKTFIDNPLIGVAYKHGCGFYRPYLYGVGNHCEFCDAFANFGIFGGVSFLSVYYFQIKEILKYKIPHKSFIWIVIIFLLGFFNPLRYFHVNFCLFFMLPAFCLVNEERITLTSSGSVIS